VDISRHFMSVEFSGNFKLVDPGGFSRFWFKV